MAITIYSAWKGYYDKELQLTTTQHTLMLQAISFFVYMEAGAAVRSCRRLGFP